MSSYYGEDDEIDIRLGRRRPTRQDSDLSIEEVSRDFPPPPAGAFIPSRSMVGDDRYGPPVRSRPPPGPGPSIAGNRRGYAEPDYPGYGRVPARPPIYPARGIRRASTLPVRFEDERVVERVVRYDAPPRRYQPGEDVVTVVEPIRRGSVGSVTSSDSEAGQRGRRKKNLVDVGTEREPLAVREAENVALPPFKLKAEELRRGPVPGVAIMAEDETSEAEAARSESPFPKSGKTRMPARLVSRRAIIDLGYPFEEEVRI